LVVIEVLTARKGPPNAPLQPRRLRIAPAGAGCNPVASLVRP